ncbi:peptidyl-prolyl cis-trans isomerase [Pseudomonas tohonis]|uniref:peptidyl-prolyl cis-trans isomerase n=1 Tax=Pseudomonas tohonis TaxID=2725477 RepID=UPI001F2AAB01|nr:peptidyl-prolyl cis-trans isomerase [Pseudomonas tohonis]
MPRVEWPLGCLLAAALLAGCRDDDGAEALAQVPVEPSATLVTVDDSPITRAQLELTVERTLGESAPLFANDEVERKILDSLVASRAMALLAERELDAGERAQLDLKAQAYREELLVRHYLEQHATPEPVTSEQVADYYQRHPEEFGGGVEKSFEIIASDQALEEPQRAELIALLSGADAKARDWQKQVAAWRAAGKPLEYRSNRIKPELLEQPLRGLVESTEVGSIAPLHADGQLLLVRVTGEERLPARPLSDVSGEIREKLAPQSLKQAVKSLSEEATRQVKVQYSSR